MTKEQFIALGLTEELATKAAEQSATELKTYIPKHRFDEITEENKTLKGTVKENETALETLKKSTGDAEALKKQIETLQTDNKTKDEQYQKDLNELKLTNAIKLAIAGKAQDEDLVAGLFDKTKLILGDDGKITGLDEQLKALQESKQFLFKEDTSATIKPKVTTSIQTNQSLNNDNNQTKNFKDAVQSAIQAQLN
ncbi:MAG: Phage minor structural protein [Herbinix sp.]|jgi:hypothetical protein|nr:Phage minor structural protein [Herbinix sp.]